MRGVRANTRSRGAVLKVVTVVLAVTGATCIVVAVASHQYNRQVPLSAVGSPSSPADGSDSAGLPSPPASSVIGLVLPESAPVSLAIPAIGVHSSLLRLGLTSEGSMEVPAPGPHYNEAGWYRYSPYPGSLGPAVIAGHVDSATQGPSVFFRLSSLRPKNRILVSRADGSVAIFTVDDVRRYRKIRFPTQLVYGNTNHAALRLITCGGPIDPATGHYRDNVVVLASLVGAADVAALPTTAVQAG